MTRKQITDKTWLWMETEVYFRSPKVVWGSLSLICWTRHAVLSLALEQERWSYREGSYFLGETFSHRPKIQLWTKEINVLVIWHETTLISSGLGGLQVHVRVRHCRRQYQSQFKWMNVRCWVASQCWEQAHICCEIPLIWEVTGKASIVTAGRNGALHRSKLVSLLELTNTKLILKKDFFVSRANYFLKSDTETGLRNPSDL